MKPQPITKVTIVTEETYPEPGALYVDPDPKDTPVRVFEFDGAFDYPDHVVAHFYGWGGCTPEDRLAIALGRASEYVAWYNTEDDIDDSIDDDLGW